MYIEGALMSKSRNIALSDLGISYPLVPKGVGAFRKPFFPMEFLD